MPHKALKPNDAPDFVGSAIDPLARARVRGIGRRDQLLAAEGGTLTTKEVAQHLGITPRAVRGHRGARKLLAFDLGRRRLRFPAWQLMDGSVLDGLDDVLAALGDAPPLAVLRFFLSGNPRLQGRRPLNSLRKHDVTAVVAAARAFGRQGAR